MLTPETLRGLRNGDNEHDAELDAHADTWENLERAAKELIETIDRDRRTVWTPALAASVAALRRLVEGE